MILDPGEREQVEEILHEIARELEEPAEWWWPTPPDGATEEAEEYLATVRTSLSNGYAGLALFFEQLALAGRDARSSARVAERYLERSIEALETVWLPPFLFEGVAGIAWVTAHLGRRRGWDLDSMLAEVDDYLHGVVVRLEDIPFDLVQGLAGLAVYWIDRGGERAAREAAVIVERLYRKVTWLNAGCCGWLSEPFWTPIVAGQRMHERYFNMGVAHGQPGVIASLRRIREMGWGNAQVEQLHRGAVAFLRRYCAEDEASGVLPAFVDSDGAPGPSARFAWCYGDLGAAAVLGDACASDPDGLRELAQHSRNSC